MLHRLDSINLSHQESAKETLELTLEVRCQHPLSYGLTNLLHSPKSSTIEFVLRGLDRSIIGGTIHIYQFPFTQTFKHIFAYERWSKISNA